MSKKEYIIGNEYEGLGKYLGVQMVYPWGKDYAYTEHKFTEGVIDNISAAKINSIFIEKVER